MKIALDVVIDAHYSFIYNALCSPLSFFLRHFLCARIITYLGHTEYIHHYYSWM